MAQLTGDQLFDLIHQTAQAQGLALAPWMAARRSILVQVLNSLLEAEQAPAQATDQPTVPILIEAPEVSTTQFVLPREKLALARAKAQALGLNIGVEDIDTRELADTYTYQLQLSKQQFMDVPFLPALTDPEKEAMQARAAAEAPRWVRVTVDAPKPTIYAVGRAEQMESAKGTPETVLSDFEPGAWTELKGVLPGHPAHLDFRECDICGLNRRRKVLWLLNDGRIAGGECADQLDLGRKLQAMLGALQGFAVWARDQEGGDDGGFGGSRRGDVDDPIKLYWLADRSVRRFGYVSKKRAEERNISSTSDDISQFLAKPDRATLDELRKAVQDGSAAALYREALEAVEAALLQPDASAFTTKVGAALRTGNLRLMGPMAYAPVLVDRLRNEALARTAQAGQPGAWEPEIGLKVTGPVTVDSRDPQGYSIGWTSLEAQGGPGAPGIDLGPLKDNAMAQRLAATWVPPYPNLHVRILKRRVHTYSEDPDLSERPAALVARDEMDALNTVLRLIAKKVPKAVGDSVTAADIRAILALDGVDVAGLADIIGQSPAAIQKTLAGAPASKALTAALAKHPPGIWAITGHRTFEGDYGTTHYFELVREGDGKRITWKSSKAEYAELPPHLRTDWQKTHYLEVGDRIRLRGVNIGQIIPEKTIRGTIYPSTREVNRVSWELVSTARAAGMDPNVLAEMKFTEARLDAIEALHQALTNVGRTLDLRTYLPGWGYGPWEGREGLAHSTGPLRLWFGRVERVLRQIAANPGQVAGLVALRAHIPVGGYLEQQIAAGKLDGPREGMPVADVLGDPDVLLRYTKELQEAADIFDAAARMAEGPNLG